MKYNAWFFVIKAVVTALMVSATVAILKPTPVYACTTVDECTECKLGEPGGPWEGFYCCASRCIYGQCYYACGAESCEGCGGGGEIE